MKKFILFLFCVILSVNLFSQHTKLSKLTVKDTLFIGVNKITPSDTLVKMSDLNQISDLLLGSGSSVVSRVEKIEILLENLFDLVLIDEKSIIMNTQAKLDTASLVPK